MTRSVTKETEIEGGWEGVLVVVARKRKSKRIMNRSRGKSRKRAAITQVDENATRTRVHVARSSGLVTYLPTYERLKAFHSRLYFRPVNRVPLLLSRTYETAAPCEAKRRSLFFSPFLLPLPPFLEKAPYRFQYV